MATGLFPEDNMEKMTEWDSEEDEYDTGYKRSMKWDPETGDFVRDSAGRVAEADGYEAFAMWCYKIIQAERDSHMAYMETVSGNDLGVETEEIAEEDDRETVESMLQRTYTEALMANPRTETVSGFEFTWEGDTVYCTFQVKGKGQDNTVQISV